jgi:Thaumarchaeal output domain 1
VEKQDTAASSARPPEEGKGDDREDLLIDADTQAIVQKMVDQGVYLIKPQVDNNGLSYPALADIFPDKSEADIAEFLDKLASAKILRSKLLDKVIVCPTCGSASVYSKYNCPRCSSFDIGKASIIEHIRCGFIGSKEKFQKGKVLVCPKCKNVVSEVDYRKIGTSFECNSCGSRFEAPKMSHKCNSCDDVFTYKEARYEPIYEFELSEETKKTVAKGTLPLASIVTTLKGADFDVGLKQDLTGKSGAIHNFDIVAKKDGVLVVANFTFEPKEEDIIGLFAKKYDVDPTFTLLIALTPPSKEEEAVSKAYGVMILSSTGTQSIGEQIVSLVDEKLRKSQLQETKPETVESEIEIKHSVISEEQPQPPRLNEEKEDERSREEESEKKTEREEQAEEAEAAESEEEEEEEVESPKEQIQEKLKPATEPPPKKKKDAGTARREFSFSDEDWDEDEF